MSIGDTDRIAVNIECGTNLVYSLITVNQTDYMTDYQDYGDIFDWLK